jgi:hypothetical protein
MLFRFKLLLSGSSHTIVKTSNVFFYLIVKNLELRVEYRKEFKKQILFLFSHLQIRDKCSIFSIVILNLIFVPVL